MSLKQKRHDLKTSPPLTPSILADFEYCDVLLVENYAFKRVKTIITDVSRTNCKTRIFSCTLALKSASRFVIFRHKPDLFEIQIRRARCCPGRYAVYRTKQFTFAAKFAPPYKCSYSFVRAHVTRPYSHFAIRINFNKITKFSPVGAIAEGSRNQSGIIQVPPA